MTLIRPSQIQDAGASTGDALVYDGTEWAPGAGGAHPTGSAGGDLAGTYPNPTVPGLATLENKLQTNLGTSSLDSDGNIVQTFTAVWGVDSTGAPYYNSAGAASGEEAVLLVADDGTLAVVKVTP